MGLGSSFLPVLLPSSFHSPEPGSLPERSVARLGDQGGTAWLGSGSTSALTLSPPSLCGHSESRAALLPTLGFCGPTHWPLPTSSTQSRSGYPGSAQRAAADCPRQPRGCWELLLHRPEQRGQLRGQNSAGGARWEHAGVQGAPGERGRGRVHLVSRA